MTSKSFIVDENDKNFYFIVNDRRRFSIPMKFCNFIDRKYNLFYDDKKIYIKYLNEPSNLKQSKIIIIPRQISDMMQFEEQSVAKVQFAKDEFDGFIITKATQEEAEKVYKKMVHIN